MANSNVHTREFMGCNEASKLYTWFIWHIITNWIHLLIKTHLDIWIKCFKIASESYNHQTKQNSIQMDLWYWIDFHCNIYAEDEMYIHLLILGIFSELGGMISIMTSWITEKARSTVMAKDTFSPLSAGNQNTPRATARIKAVGQMMLKTWNSIFRFHMKLTCRRKNMWIGVWVLLDFKCNLTQ